MDKNTLAGNILILSQAEELAAAFAGIKLPAVLLKGAALVASFPGYMHSRRMEDIDLLIRPRDLSAARAELSRLGYLPAPEDPCAMLNPSKTVPVDLTSGLWYLDGEENEKLFNDSLEHRLEGFSGSFSRLKEEDFYIHVLAHGAVHHAEVNAKWKEDLALIRDNWGTSMDWKEVEDKLKRYGFEKAARLYLSGGNDGSLYGRILKSGGNPLKGHVSRFLCLPLKKKAAYLAATLFPSREFLLNRYKLKNGEQVLFFRLIRPFLLLANLASFAKRLLF